MALKIIRSVTFLAQMWQANISRMSGVEQEPLTRLQLEQLRMLRNTLGFMTWDVMLWASENWMLLFCESCAPPKPDIGLLFTHCELVVPRLYEIAKSTNTVHAAEFVKNLDRMIYEGIKEDIMAACEDDPDFLAMVEGVKTLDDLKTILGLLDKRSIT
jgi:hypothetical protein